MSFGLQICTFLVRTVYVKLQHEDIPVLYEAIVAVFLVIRTPKVSGPGVELVMVDFSEGDSVDWLFSV
jgi:hypothetical protein